MIKAHIFLKLIQNVAIYCQWTMGIDSVLLQLKLFQSFVFLYRPIPISTFL